MNGMYIAFQSWECWTTLLYMYRVAQSLNVGKKEIVQTNCGQLKLIGHTE